LLTVGVFPGHTLLNGDKKRTFNKSFTINILLLL